LRLHIYGHAKTVAVWQRFFFSFQPKVKKPTQLPRGALQSQHLPSASPRLSSDPQLLSFTLSINTLTFYPLSFSLSIPPPARNSHPFPSIIKHVLSLRRNRADAYKDAWFT